MTRSGLVRDNKPIKKRQYKKKETKNNESNQEHEPSLNLVLDDSVTESTQSKRRKIDVESIAEDNASTTNKFPMKITHNEPFTIW